MSCELQFAETEETQALLQDVLAFLDENSSSEGATSSPTSIQSPYVNGDRKKRRAKVYSPDYERSRREKKKAERETLRSQVAQYETQLELLRLQKPVQSANSQWSWVHAATDEEEKRRKAEEINYQLRGLLIQQLNAAQILGGLVMQQATFAQRIQVLLSQFSPCATPMPPDTFTSIGAIAMHLKGTIQRLRLSADPRFSLYTLEMDASSGELMSSANVIYGDESCIELRSSTPLACSFEDAVPLLWSMLLDKKVLGSQAGYYTIKTKKVTQNSAEFGYSINFSPSGVLYGVTMFEKDQDENRAVLQWASMMVEQGGKPFSRSQGYFSVSRLSRNSQQESVVRSSSRLSGNLLGVSSDSAHENIPVTRKNLAASKARLERAQLRIMERAELQDI